MSAVVFQSGLFRCSAILNADFLTLTPPHDRYGRGRHGGSSLRGIGHHALPVQSTGLEYFRDVYPHWYRGGSVHFGEHPKGLTRHRNAHHWYLVDAAGEHLDITAAKVAKLVSNQHSATYSGRPSDYNNVVVINVSKLMLPEQQWNFDPYWNVLDDRPESHASMLRAKQVYQKDPGMIMFWKIWHYLPHWRRFAKSRSLGPFRKNNFMATDHKRVFAAERVHLFMHDEHPFEHLYPIDMTHQLVVSRSEYSPAVQYKPHTGVYYHRSRFSGRIIEKAPSSGEKNPYKSGPLGSEGRMTHTRGSDYAQNLSKGLGPSFGR